MKVKTTCEIILDEGTVVKTGDHISFNFLGEHIEGILGEFTYWEPIGVNCIEIQFPDARTNPYKAVSRLFAINLIENCRLIEKQQEPILTEEEIDCFNDYIKDAGMDIAFGNDDWNAIYRKIVGDRISEYAKHKQDQYFDVYRDE